MTASLCLVMAQINPLVGDITGNVDLVIKAAQQAKDEHQADMVVFPELTLTGYPPEDLLFRAELLRRVKVGLLNIKENLKGIAVVVGYPELGDDGQLYNAASVIADGQCLATYYKQELPNYSVFDEKRYFTKGTQATVFNYGGIRFGLTICEDIWFTSPASQAADKGAEVMLNLNASPFKQKKHEQREHVVAERVAETACAVIYVNLVGGQDELVFDGSSFAMTAQGEKVASAPAWETSLCPVMMNKVEGRVQLTGSTANTADDLAMTYQALVVGLRDYVEKNHFPSVVIGLSGGIDSALTLALAVDAIGADRVSTVMMPSQYTAQMSLDDAKTMADGLGVPHSEIAIDTIFQQFKTDLAPHFKGTKTDTTEENIQARCRGVILMALSNKTGAMVLSTGNKSEMAVGYSTLYGDMAGGYSPLKDVYKTLVYQLADYRNTLHPVIPERIITRPPSAELAEDQLDQDSLPPYEVLDRILEQYIALDWSFQEMVAAGAEPELVQRVITLVDRNEYKRRQAPPGIRITGRAFGRERRYPITSGYTVT